MEEGAGDALDVLTQNRQCVIRRRFCEPWKL